MAEVPAQDYFKSLQSYLETAEKLLSRAEADVANAKQRREEARAIKEEALSRLEEAKKRYGIIATPGDPLLTSPEETRKKIKPVESPGSLLMSASGRRKKQVRSPIPKLQSRESSGRAAVHKELHKRDSNRLAKIGSRGDLYLQRVDLVQPVLDICKGRSREWYEANLDSESLGLVKTFYKAALGTKTKKNTDHILVSSVLLNDEWNDIVKTTGQVQELYIGTSAHSEDGKTSLRDRAARALIQPPQKDSLAIFFAPKNNLGTDNVYYGGHWKVVAGNMFEPPQVVKGHPRQCLVKFMFTGIDPDIVKAINEG